MCCGAISYPATITKLRRDDSPLYRKPVAAIAVIATTAIVKVDNIAAGTVYCLSSGWHHCDIICAGQAAFIINNKAPSDLRCTRQRQRYAASKVNADNAITCSYSGRSSSHTTIVSHEDSRRPESGHANVPRLTQKM